MILKALQWLHESMNKSTETTGIPTMLDGCVEVRQEGKVSSKLWDEPSLFLQMLPRSYECFFLFSIYDLNRYKSKKKAFTKASKKWQDDLGRKSIERDFKKIIKYCKVVRVIAHTQVCIFQFRSFSVYTS